MAALAGDGAAIASATTRASATAPPGRGPRGRRPAAEARGAFTVHSLAGRVRRERAVAGMTEPLEELGGRSLPVGCVDLDRRAGGRPVCPVEMALQVGGESICRLAVPVRRHH